MIVLSEVVHDRYSSAVTFFQCVKANLCPENPFDVEVMLNSASLGAQRLRLLLIIRIVLIQEKGSVSTRGVSHGVRTPRLWTSGAISFKISATLPHTAHSLIARRCNKGLPIWQKTPHWSQSYALSVAGTPRCGAASRCRRDGQITTGCSAARKPAEISCSRWV